MQSSIAYVKSNVHRPSGIWTRQVHKFLLYLHMHGFDKVPKPLGFDEQGREIVSFLQGDTTEELLSEVALISAAKLLHTYHQVSSRFLEDNHISIKSGWLFPAMTPKEVICHSDFAPYNICFVKEQAVGIIDFDTAHPGPRIWDIAYALYRCVPFMKSDNENNFKTIEQQIERAYLFCQAYGISKIDIKGITAVIINRLQALLAFLINSAKEGETKYILNMQNNHHIKYLIDLEYIRHHQIYIEARLQQLIQNC